MGCTGVCVYAYVAEGGLGGEQFACFCSSNMFEGGACTIYMRVCGVVANYYFVRFV